MRTLFVPLAVLALAVPPVFAQPSLPTQQAATGTSTSAASSQASASLEPAGPLTLRSALALAFQANPGLFAALREREATDGALLQAGAWPNPTLDVTLEDTRRDNRTTTVQLSQPIELGGKRAARVSAAERARDQAESALAAKRAELRATAITLFFEVLSAHLETPIFSAG